MTWTGGALTLRLGHEGEKPNRSSSSDLGNARAKNAQQEPTQRRGEPWSAKAQNAKQEPAPRRGEPGNTKAQNAKQEPEKEPSAPAAQPQVEAVQRVQEHVRASRQRRSQE